MPAHDLLECRARLFGRVWTDSAAVAKPGQCPGGRTVFLFTLGGVVRIHRPILLLVLFACRHPAASDCVDGLGFTRDTIRIGSASGASDGRRHVIDFGRNETRCRRRDRTYIRSPELA